jgi:hypothetical protein
MHINSILRHAALLVAVCALPSVAQQGNGFLKIKVNPGRAGVFVDGKYVGPASNFGIGRKYAVAPGEHEIKLAEPRYEEAVTKVTVQAGKTATVSQTLKALEPAKPPFGMIRIKADKYTPVFVNGKFMGHADEFNNSMQGLKLNPGTYGVKIGDGPEEQVKLEADKVVVLQGKQ